MNIQIFGIKKSSDTRKAESTSVIEESRIIWGFNRGI
jgi:hypothetical protein